MKEKQPLHHYDPYHGHPHHRCSMTIVLPGFGLLVCLMIIEATKLIWLYRGFGTSADIDDDDDFFASAQRWRVPLENSITDTNTTKTLTKTMMMLRNDTIQRTTTGDLAKLKDPQAFVCGEQMQQVFQRHQCMLQLSHGDECLLLPPTMREDDHQSIPMKMMRAGEGFSARIDSMEPVHHLSFMWGQGFGRILQHSVRTCLLAALLHRPCSIDMIRDRYHNLRSFIQPGPYDWDEASRLVMVQHGVNVSHALHLMPQGVEKGHGWESLLNAQAAADGKNNTLNKKAVLPDYNDVLPMVWGTTKKPNPELIRMHLNDWDRGNSQHGHKVLLSPNFADAWYAYGKDYISPERQWNKHHKYCTGNHMKTYLQNEMFVPTSLAYELHRERRAIVLQEQEAQNDNYKKQKRLTTRSGLSSRTVLPPYGAIHLRMKILNQDMYKMGVTKEQALNGLKQCLDTLSKDETLFPDMRWWLISDDVDTAQFVTQELDNVHSFASAALPPPPPHGGNTKANPPENKNVIVKGAHSGDAIEKRFGQEALAPSITDWMGLHESHIALVTYDSAYGETGARGNGKIMLGHCGGVVKNSRNSFPMFNIYKKDSKLASWMPASSLS